MTDSIASRARQTGAGRMAVVATLVAMVTLMMILAPVAHGQGTGYTQVSAQVLDSAGTAYANCRYNVFFVNQSTAPILPNLGGSPFQDTYTGAQCDSNGNLSIRLPDNTVIAPTPSQWKFSITDINGKCAFTYQVTITGASQVITSGITAVAPLIVSCDPSLVPVTVSSVFGRTGAVTAQSGDYSYSQISGTPTIPPLGGGSCPANQYANSITASTAAPGCAHQLRQPARIGHSPRCLFGAYLR
jgi:hypothetical protein